MSSYFTKAIERLTLNQFSFIFLSVIVPSVYGFSSFGMERSVHQVTVHKCAS